MEARLVSRSILFIVSLFSLNFLFNPSIHAEDWQLGEFARVDEANPILSPCPESVFHCPIQNKDIQWEKEHIFNPAAVVRNGKVYLIYRAEDQFGVGQHTSRLGLAESSDGIYFVRSGVPVLFPDLDDQSAYEFPGGCEDPRIVETEEGMYVMTYTQWNRQIAVLAIATSYDLLHWKKHGYAFENDHRLLKRWSKAGSIVCKQLDDRLIATKIMGKYWMYWGEGEIYAATSDDLISWFPILDEDHRPIVVLARRDGKFDSALVEAGPPALLTEKGILLIYNGKNSAGSVAFDPNLAPRTYSAGQLLLDVNDPTTVISRCEQYFLTPERPYEMSGQYRAGTVFVQGLVSFQNQWFLYYGTADSAIGVAIAHQ